MTGIETNLRECVEVLKQQLQEKADEADTVRRHLIREESENRRLREWLTEEVHLLDKWAEGSVSGGWSTHQVEPMRRRADALRRLLV